MRAFLFILLLISAFITIDAQSSKERNVRASWGKYKNAILENRGTEAVEFVSNSTIEYYNKLLELALNGDSTSIDTLQIFDKAAVFTFRIKIPLTDIINLNGKGFFTYCTNEGLINNNNVTTLEIGDIEINKNEAKARVINKGIESTEHLTFYKEGRTWKVDFISQITAANQQIEQKVTRVGMGHNQFVYELLKRMYGEFQIDNIWKPMK